MEQRRTPDKSSDTSERHSEIAHYPANDISQLPHMPTIIENGEERIRPDVMAFLMQAAQASHLARLRLLEESKIPIGSWSIDATITTRRSIIPPDPLISFTFINDGPSRVFLETSMSRNEKYLPRFGPILNGETFTYDAVYPVIESILLDVAAGDTAAIRLKAKAGRRIGSSA